MAPEARVYYPVGQENVMRTAIATLGGRVLNIKEDKPLKVVQISAGRFVEFIQQMEPSFAIPKISFQSAFSTLRPLPKERQRQIITTFLSQRVEGFPNAEEYSRFLTDLNILPWFSLKEEPRPSQIQEFVDQFRERYGKKPIRTRIVRDLETAFEHRFRMRDFHLQNRREEKKWDEKTEEERRVDYEARRLAEDASTSSIREAVERCIEKSGLDLNRATTDKRAQAMTRGIISTILRAANWIKDNLDKENPYLPLLDIFKLGGWPIGEVEGEFLVFFPEQIQIQLSQ